MSDTFLLSGPHSYLSVQEHIPELSTNCVFRPGLLAGAESKYGKRYQSSGCSCNIGEMYGDTVTGALLLDPIVMSVIMPRSTAQSVPNGHIRHAHVSVWGLSKRKVVSRTTPCRCRESGAPLFLILTLKGSECSASCLGHFTPQRRSRWDPLEKRLSGSQSQSECCGEKKISSLCQELNSDSLDILPMTRHNDD
jgi:hypothetical protein